MLSCLHCNGLEQERVRERFKMIQELDEVGAVEGGLEVGVGNESVIHTQFNYIIILQHDGMKDINRQTVLFSSA